MWIIERINSQRELEVCVCVGIGAGVGINLNIGYDAKCVRVRYLPEATPLTKYFSSFLLVKSCDHDVIKFVCHKKG